MEYRIRRATAKPQLDGRWDAPPWRDADVAEVASFHPRSSDHRPQAHARVVYDDVGLYVHFRVQDRYVVCTRTENQTMTCRDSCVETFLQPVAGKGYFNFEMNCVGTLLLFYVLDPTRSKPGILKHKHIVPQWRIDTMRVYHSVPTILAAEVSEPLEWSVAYFLPYGLLEHYVGKLPPPAGRAWRGNFYKCADGSSHPHWASWAPIGPELNFHVPAAFGTLRFEA